MRLLQYNNNGEFSLTKDFIGGKIPEYAILSHTWGAETEEVTYKDLTYGTKVELSRSNTPLILSILSLSQPLPNIGYARLPRKQSNNCPRQKHQGREWHRNSPIIFEAWFYYCSAGCIPIENWHCEDSLSTISFFPNVT